MEATVQRVLTKDDFAWLDLPSPVLLDTVRTAPVDQLLSLVDKAALNSDTRRMAIQASGVVILTHCTLGRRSGTQTARWKQKNQ